MAGKILGLVIIFCLIITLTCGCSDSDSTEDLFDTTKNAYMPTPTPSADGIQIVVYYKGYWSGVYGDISGSSSVDGKGDKTITINRAKSFVSCTFQKSDSGSEKLTVQILKNGKVLEERDTTAQYGIVTCSAKI